MHREKSKRNKTIDFDLDTGKHWLASCIDFNESNTYTEYDICNKIIIGDTFSVLPHLPTEYADLVIVDPPYNLAKNYHGKSFYRTSDSEYADYTRRWLDALLPLLKNRASIYVCCDWQSSLIIGNVLSEKLIVRNRITWQREKGRGAYANWKNCLEDIWFATVSEEYTFNADAVKMRKRVIAPYTQDGKPKDWEKTDDGNFRDTYASNFWADISIPYWSMSENTAHPTQKSEKLLAKLILASSNEGDIVLDPFNGSGSTSVTAKKLRRNYTGIEQNPLYCAWCESRLEQANTDTKIQGFENGIFYERNERPPTHVKNQECLP